jgi:hypothetical protein
MSTFISGFHSLCPSLVAFVVVFALLSVEAVLSYATVRVSSQYDPTQTPLMAGLWAAMALLVGVVVYGAIPVAMGFFAQRLTKTFLSRTITPVAWKFFEFKVSAWTMRVRLKDFRRIMDAEYKKIAPN